MFLVGGCAQPKSLRNLLDFHFGSVGCLSDGLDNRDVGIDISRLKNHWLVVWNIDFIFPEILEVSSSQLTNSYFSEG